MVRRAALLRLPGVESLQDAHPRAAVQVPQLYALRDLRRRAAEDRVHAVAPGQPRQRRCGAAARAALPAARRSLAPRATGGPARSDGARPHAAADRAHPPFLRRADAALRPARRRAQAAAGRGAHAPGLPVRRRHRLPDAGPAEPHAVGRRSPAHQPDHGTGHLAGQHAVRARRTQHRPAPARPGPHRPSDAAAARRRQHVGRGRTRPVGHARRRPPDRHGPRPRRARRHHRLRRHAGLHPRGRHTDRRLPVRPPSRGRCDPLAAPRRRRGNTAPRARRRGRAQPVRHHGRGSAAAAGLHHGVSGSGKSTLVQDVLHPALARHFGKATEAPGAYRAARRAPGQRCGLRRPIADRQDRALEPGELRRRLR